MTGTCHCGRVAFEVLGSPDAAFRCNCSYCSRRGWLHAYARPEDFRLVRGAESLREYRFGARTTANYFCAVCGIHTHFYTTYADRPRYAFSLACCDDFDPSGLEVRHVDGKSF